VFVFFFNSSHLAETSRRFLAPLPSIQSSATEIATFPSNPRARKEERRKFALISGVGFEFYWSSLGHLSPHI
jgi:hypothetical protein